MMMPRARQGRKGKARKGKLLVRKAPTPNPPPFRGGSARSGGVGVEREVRSDRVILNLELNC